MRTRFALAFIIMTGCLLVGACSRTPTPHENARRNFLDSFGQMVSVLRVWNCDGPVKGSGDSEIVQCEYIIHGGYITEMYKSCSTKPNGDCN